LQCEKSTTVEQEKSIESIDSRFVNTSNNDVFASATETLGAGLSMCPVVFL